MERRSHGGRDGDLEERVVRIPSSLQGLDIAIRHPVGMAGDGIAICVEHGGGEGTIALSLGPIQHGLPPGCGGLAQRVYDRIGEAIPEGFVTHDLIVSHLSHP